MTQYGFFFDETRCVDCRACVVSCRDWYNIPSGPVKLSRMFSGRKERIQILSFTLSLHPAITVQMLSACRPRMARCSRKEPTEQS